MPTIIIWSFAKANNKWVTNFNKGKKTSPSKRTNAFTCLWCTKCSTLIPTQSAFTSSKSTIETLDKCVKSIQS